MDALQMLREDHRRVKELFREFEEAEDKATKQAAADTTLVELNIHAVLEEEIFYPAVRGQGNGSGEMVERAEQEHHTAEQLMNELMNMEPGNQEFDAKFHVLIENVKSHIDEEEAEMLPQAAEVGLPRLEQLGERMEQRRQQLLKEGGNGSQRTRSAPKSRSRSTSGTKSRASGGSRTKSGTRPRASSRTKSGTSSRTRAGTGTKSSSGTRTRSASKNGSRASGTRSRAGSSSRSRTTSGTTSKSRASASRTRTRSSSATGRTVKQAGGSRTTRTRSNTGGRRSGSQSGQ